MHRVPRGEERGAHAHRYTAAGRRRAAGREGKDPGRRERAISVIGGRVFRIVKFRTYPFTGVALLSG